MFLERLNESGIKGSKYWYDKTFNKGADSSTGLPNCTCYCVGRFQEEAFADEPLKMFTDRSPGGFPNAKDWLKNWAYEKGTEPKVGGVLVWDGNGSGVSALGHVAIVERVIKKVNSTTWKVLVSQSAYGGYFWKKAEYTISPNVKTSGVGFVYLGCAYSPFITDRIVPRNTKRDQVEVLAELLNVRKSPNGEKYEGRFCPTGLFNILALEDSGSYTWAKLDTSCWIALNDSDGWTKTYSVENEGEKIAELEKQITDLEREKAALQESGQKLQKMYNDLLEKKDALQSKVNTLTNTIEKVRKAVQ